LLAVAPYPQSRQRDSRVTKTLRILNPVPQRILETVSFMFPPAKTALSTLSNDILCPENDCVIVLCISVIIWSALREWWEELLYSTAIVAPVPRPLASTSSIIIVDDCSRDYTSSAHAARSAYMANTGSRHAELKK